jgi:SagB-type dehydrogenase family enzyme
MITRRNFLGGGFVSLLAAQYAEMAWGAQSDTWLQESKKELSVKKAIGLRRTMRSFIPKTLLREHLMEILWSAQGITDRIRGLRSVPSAGALYPLEIHVFIGGEAVAGIGRGVYQYRPGHTDIQKVNGSDLREDLASACLSQLWIASAPVSLVISAVYARTTKKYGQRGIRYADIETGCAAQNVFLMAISLGLDAGIVGAFEDRKVRALTGAGEGSQPLLVMPIGYRA